MSWPARPPPVTDTVLITRSAGFIGSYLAKVLLRTSHNVRITDSLIEQVYPPGAQRNRLFNVYGAGQSLSNPYTGVLAIFASRLLHGQRPMVFGDGEPWRNLVHVEDVARAFMWALDTPGAVGGDIQHRQRP